MLKAMQNLAAVAPGCLLILVCLTACQRSTTVDVNLHGVNYTRDTFSYSISDPTTPGKPSSGGEMVDPFAAGGTTCCATLPLVWQPGLKLQVNVTNWRQEQPPDGELVETKETHLVEVPPYPNGKPGEIWVLRTTESAISLVSSDFQPNHPNWPGRVKGWPVPSLEYRRERWKIHFAYEESGLKTALSLMEDFNRDPKAEARSDWEYARENDPERIKSFSGPDDPKYILFLKNKYEAFVVRQKNNVKQLLEEKP